jgi:hypothetical protein
MQASGVGELQLPASLCSAQASERQKVLLGGDALSSNRRREDRVFCVKLKAAFISHKPGRLGAERLQAVQGRKDASLGK